jgi:hypothetical protein
MSTKAAISQIDATLKPAGFSRHKFTWNRRSGDLCDVVDIQVNKFGDLMTINAGVVHFGIYELCWGRRLPEVVDEPFCTVRARIGHLIDGGDVWWNTKDTTAAIDMANTACRYVLPFFDEMHSLSAMQRLLDKKCETVKHDPMLSINLALLRHELGDHDGACEMLQQLKANSNSAWENRTSEILARLKCTGHDR